MHTKSNAIDLRRPIDLQMLGQLVSATKAVIPVKFTKLCVAAKYMLAFHGFLSIGKNTVQAEVLFEYVIQWSDLEIVPGTVVPTKPLCASQSGMPNTIRLAGLLGSK